MALFDIIGNTESSRLRFALKKLNEIQYHIAQSLLGWSVKTYF